MTRDYWPTEEWETCAPESLGCNPDNLQQIARSIPEYGNITSVLAIKNGYLAFEEYSLNHESDGCWGLREGAPPHTSGHYVFSVTKSILSAVVGVAIDKGYIKDVDQPVADFLDDANESIRRDLLIKHLLTMTAGIDRSEPGPEIHGRENIAHNLQLPTLTEPGTQFRYDNESANLLSSIISVSSGMNAYELGKRFLFDDMGFKVDWGQASSQNKQDSPGGAGIVLTARGMAKFGYLYLNKGKWEDKELLSPSWIKKSTRIHTAGGPPCGDDYGYLWWIGKIDGERTCYAAGMHGQKLMIFPQFDLVLAITCDGRKGRVRNHLVEQLLEVFGT